jgi:hypothetical protein
MGGLPAQLGLGKTKPPRYHWRSASDNQLMIVLDKGGRWAGYRAAGSQIVLIEPPAGGLRSHDQSSPPLLLLLLLLKLMLSIAKGIPALFCVRAQFRELSFQRTDSLLHSFLSLDLVNQKYCTLSLINYPQL